jgi:hypothetical protein
MANQAFGRPSAAERYHAPSRPFKVAGGATRRPPEAHQRPKFAAIRGGMLGNVLSRGMVAQPSVAPFIGRFCVRGERLRRSDAASGPRTRPQYLLRESWQETEVAAAGTKAPYTQYRSGRW